MYLTICSKHWLAFKYKNTANEVKIIRKQDKNDFMDAKQTLNSLYYPLKLMCTNFYSTFFSFQKQCALCTPKYTANMQPFAAVFHFISSSFFRGTFYTSYSGLGGIFELSEMFSPKATVNFLPWHWCCRLNTIATGLPGGHWLTTTCFFG